MKRLTAIILTGLLLMTAATLPAAAKQVAGWQSVYESFEGGQEALANVSGGDATHSAELQSPGANNSNGAMRLLYTDAGSNSSTLGVNGLGMKKGYKYKASAWMKYNNAENLATETIKFIYYLPMGTNATGTMTDGTTPWTQGSKNTVYTATSTQATGILKGGWTKVEAIFDYNGTMSERGTGSVIVDDGFAGRVIVRVGAGSSADYAVGVTDFTVDLSVDDLIVEPYTEPAVKDSIIVSDGFEEASPCKADTNIVRNVMTSGGAAGTSSYMSIGTSSAASAGGIIYQNADLVPSKTYKLSWYAKLNAAPAKDTYMWMIFNCKNSILVGSGNYIYATKSGFNPLSTEWQYYEYTFKTKNNMTTYNLTKPFFSTRLYDGVTSGSAVAKVDYSVDEIKLEMVEDISNGGFNEGFNTPVSQSKNAVVNSWEKGANTEVEYVGAASAGSSAPEGGYVNVTANLTEITDEASLLANSVYTYTNLAEGKYQISFYAKGSGNLDVYNAYTDTAYIKAGSASLTSAWKRYTMVFDEEAARYANILAFSGADFALDKVDIIEAGQPVVSDIHVNGELKTGATINIGYLIDFAKAAETASIVKIYSGDGQSFSLETAIGGANAGAAYTIPSALGGKYLKFEIASVDAEGNLTAASAYQTDKPVQAENEISVRINSLTENSAAAGVSISAVKQADITAVLAAYDANGRMLNADIKNLAIPVGYSDTTNLTVSAPGLTKARAFVLDAETLAPLAAADEAIKRIFAQSDPVSVVFLGGSITQAGTDFNNSTVYSFRNRVSEYYKNIFPNSVCYNAGVGGTDSSYGLLRLNRDVISKNPDVVFVEFAVNDAGRDTTRYMESIVRSLAECEKAPYVVFLYTTTSSYNVLQGYHRAIAEHYGIPQIDLQAALIADKAANGRSDSYYFSDGTHPTSEGHAVYADAIISALESGKYYKKPALKADKLSAASSAVSTTFVHAADCTKSSGWSSVSNGKYPYDVVITSGTGEAIEYTFTGSILAIEQDYHSQGGQYEVYIDGTLAQACDTFYKTTTNDQLVVKYSNFNLENKEHTVRIVTTGTASAGSTGTRVGIYHIIYGGAAE